MSSHLEFMSGGRFLVLKTKKNININATMLLILLKLMRLH